MNDIPHDSGDDGAPQDRSDPRTWDPLIAPEHLPPVQPPSAGFIVQLFLVPALIVTVVVGVYLLFGQLAAGEQDWRRQLSDLRSDNPHVRWRGALGLAQMLQSDAAVDGQLLRQNREVGTELANLLQSSLDRPTHTEDDLKRQEFLTRTLGQLDLPDVALPVLVQAIQPGEDREVRKNGLASISSIAGRNRADSARVATAAVLDAVLHSSEEADSMIRHVATFTLGLLDSPRAEDRLIELLSHADQLTQINAAIGLARSDSKAGLPTFEAVLRQSADHAGGSSTTSRDPSGENGAESAEVEQMLMLVNTLRAISDLSPQLTESERERLGGLLDTISAEHPEPRLRVEAEAARTALLPTP
jgi:HEAT repeat protein